MVLDGHHNSRAYVIEEQCPGQDFSPTCLSLFMIEEEFSQSPSVDFPFCARMGAVVHGLAPRAVGRPYAGGELCQVEDGRRGVSG